MDHLIKKEELKCVLMDYGALCVAMIGTPMMLEWSVSSWVMQTQVNIYVL